MKLTIHNHGDGADKVIDGSIEEVRQGILALGVGHENDTLEELVEQLNDSQNVEADLEFGPREEQDDPNERILDLKNAGASVAELRAALHDEDPRVRQAAAMHPHMTEGLLHEALQHEDPWTREQALQHPDINEGHLEAVLFDPEMRHAVAGHPKLSHEQGARLVNDHLTDEYLRDGLLKGIGYIEYPHFGQPGPSEAGPMSQKQIALRLRLRGHDPKDYPGMSGLTVGTTNRTKPVSPNKRGFVMGYRTTKNPQWQAARAHETQHGVFHRLAQDWGRQGADAARDHVMGGLSFVEKRALKGLVSSPQNSFQVEDPEEHLAYAQSYLNDQHFRNAIHSNLRLRQPHQQRAFGATIKTAVQKMRQAAASLHPEHLGLTRKTETEQIGDYLGKVMSGYLNRDLDPELPSSKTKFESIQSREVHPGIYHHVYSLPHFASIGYRPVLHAISHDPSPFNTDAIRSSARVGEYDAKQFTQDDDTRKYKHPFTEGPMAMVNYVATTPGWRGHGYGGHLYDAMARHHGQLVSDTMVSNDAQKRWGALHAHPDFEGGMGGVSTLNTAPLNWAKHRGEKPLPQKMLTNPAEHTFGEMKELHDPEPIQKTSPPPAFPRLHVGPQRRESRVLADERELHGAFRRLHHADMQLQHQDYERDPNAHMGNLAADAAKYRGKLSTDRAVGKENPMHGWNFTGNHPYRQSAVLGSKFLPQKSWLHNDEAKDAYVRSNLQHEDLHGLFGLVERKYGRKGRTQLAANIVNAMPKEHQYALAHLLHGIAGNSYDERAPSHVNEELLAHLMNYMNGEPMRRRYHASSNHSPEEERIHNKLLKQAYRHLQAISARASEKWTQGPAELSKMVPPEGSENSVEDISASEGPSQKELAQASISRMKPQHRQMAQDWFDFIHGTKPVRPRVTPSIERHLARFGVVDPEGYSYNEFGRDLAVPMGGKKVFNKQPDALAEHKRRNSWATYNLPYQKGEEALFEKHEDDLYNAVAVLQAGASGIHEPLLLAAAFLAGQAPDPERFRSALALDMEPEAAALKAVGLEPTKENLDGLQAVLAIQTEHVHPLRKGHVEHQVSGEDAPLAAVIQEAFDDDEVKPVSFKGKHTGGMAVATDTKSQHRFLLKPGSGDLSPATGVREETASQTAREVAYYEIATQWQLQDFFSPTALLTIDGKDTAVMHLLPENWKNLNDLRKDPHALAEALHKPITNGAIHRLAALAFVLGDADAHGGNFMVGPKSDGYPIKSIDHGSSFAGLAFSPSRDTKSFVFYPLRALAGSRWKEMSSKERLKEMPTLGLGEDDNLRQWVDSIDEHAMVEVMSKFGIRAEPSLLRLNALKRAATEASSLSRAVNEMWLGL